MSISTTSPPPRSTKAEVAMPALCGVILAAGASSRMGSDKALLPWPPNSENSTALLAAQIAALRPFTQTLIVVAGKNADSLAPIVEAGGATLVVNTEPDRGQFSSLQMGVRAAVERGLSAVMVTPVDCPPLSAASLAKLCAEFDRTLVQGLWAVMPENDGRHGHPLLAGKLWMDTILAAPVTSNAREVKHAHEQLFAYVPVAENSRDMNTPEEYAARAAQESASS